MAEKRGDEHSLIANLVSRHRAGVAPAEDAEVLDQVGRLGDVEVEAEHPDVDGLLDRQFSGNVLLKLT